MDSYVFVQANALPTRRGAFRTHYVPLNDRARSLLRLTKKQGFNSDELQALHEAGLTLVVRRWNGSSTSPARDVTYTAGPLPADFQPHIDGWCGCAECCERHCLTA